MPVVAPLRFHRLFEHLGQLRLSTTTLPRKKWNKRKVQYDQNTGQCGFIATSSALANQDFQEILCLKRTEYLTYLTVLFYCHFEDFGQRSFETPVAVAAKPNVLPFYVRTTHASNFKTKPTPAILPEQTNMQTTDSMAL